MQQQIDPRLPKDIKQIEQDVLINRSQMVIMARDYNLYVSKSTIHRWANEPDFPRVMGQNGRNLLYAKGKFVAFLKQRLKRIQEER